MSSDKLFIERTERDWVNDRWVYLLNNGKLVYGKAGGARIPAGLEWSERNQWAANRLFGRAAP